MNVDGEVMNYGILKICINFTKQGLLSFLERIFFKFSEGKKNLYWKFRQDLDTRKNKRWRKELVNVDGEVMNYMEY